MNRIPLLHLGYMKNAIWRFSFSFSIFFISIIPLYISYISFFGKQSTIESLDCTRNLKSQINKRFFVKINSLSKGIHFSFCKIDKTTEYNKKYRSGKWIYPVCNRYNFPYHKLHKNRQSFQRHYKNTALARFPFRSIHTQEPYANRALKLRSSVAYVIDQTSNETLIDKNSRIVVPIASISKLMTAIIVLDAKMPLEDKMTITNEDLDYEKRTSSRLTVGSKLSRADMLHIALMSSENRAASALSRYFPGGRSAFISAMNQKARELGMLDTRFTNATGLSSQNVSSARDLVKLIKVASQYQLICQYSTDTDHEVYTGKGRLHYTTTNALTRCADWKIGLQKTGFINEAGECLVMKVRINQRSILMVLLDSWGKRARLGDAQRIRQWLTRGLNYT